MLQEANSLYFVILNEVKNPFCFVALVLSYGFFTSFRMTIQAWFVYSVDQCSCSYSDAFALLILVQQLLIIPDSVIIRRAGDTARPGQRGPGPAHIQGEKNEHKTASPLLL